MATTFTSFNDRVVIAHRPAREWLRNIGAALGLLAFFALTSATVVGLRALAWWLRS